MPISSGELELLISGRQGLEGGGDTGRRTNGSRVSLGSEKALKLRCRDYHSILKPLSCALQMGDLDGM